MTLERSNKVQERIDTIREEIKQLPTRPYTNDTESDGEAISEKRELAQRFRTELILETAELAQTVFTTIYENPQITIEELEEKVSQTGSVLNGEATSEFIHNIFEDVAKVADLVEDAKALGTPVEKLVFEALQEDRNNIVQAANPITLYTFPCAVAVELTPEDFLKVDPRTNIGGFIVPYVNITLNNKVHKLPVIAVKRDMDFITKQVLQHEVGHAENEQFMRLQNTESLHVRWSKKDAGEINTRVLVYRVRGVGEDELQEVQEDLDLLLEYALSRAKNEILAEMNVVNGRTQEHAQYLLDPEGVYNYFIQLKLPPNSPAYKYLWKRYTNELQIHTSKAMSLWKTYNRAQNHVTNKKSGRTVLLSYVLAQYPIQEWNEVIEQTAFPEEQASMERLNDVENAVRMKILNCSIFLNERSDLRPHALRSDLSYVETVTQEFEANFVRKPAELVDERAEEVIAKLTKRITDLEETQAFRIYTLFNNAKMLGIKFPDAHFTEFPKTSLDTLHELILQELNRLKQVSIEYKQFTDTPDSVQVETVHITPSERKYSIEPVLEEMAGEIRSRTQNFRVSPYAIHDMYEDFVLDNYNARPNASLLPSTEYMRNVKCKVRLNEPISDYRGGIFITVNAEVAEQGSDGQITWVIKNKTYKANDLRKILISEDDLAWIPGRDQSHI